MLDNEITIVDEIKAAIGTGRDCNNVKAYKQLYEKASGKKYSGGCNSCACKFLFNWLSIYIKNNKI